MHEIEIPRTVQNHIQPVSPPKRQSYIKKCIPDSISQLFQLHVFISDLVTQCSVLVSNILCSVFGSDNSAGIFWIP